MKLMTLQQYAKMSKPALIRKITKTLRMMPKEKLVRLCYNITKAKLHHLTLEGYIETRTRKEIKEDTLIPTVASRRRTAKGYKDFEKHYEIAKKKRKTKRKFSRKQLAAQRLFAKRARAGTLKRRRR